MPLYLTDTNGPQVDNRTGAWIPKSDTYISTAITGDMSQRRLYLAQISDIYLVTFFMQVTSVGGVGAAVTPRVTYWGDWETGNGMALQADGTPMAAVGASATSSAILAIRAANSDIFISAVAPASGGAAPAYRMYIRLSRPS